MYLQGRWGLYANFYHHEFVGSHHSLVLNVANGALDKLAHIGGYTYLKQGVPEAGVIAQEVEEILPPNPLPRLS